MFDEKKKALTNTNNGDTYRFGRKVKVKLKEATPITGGLIFEILSKPEKGEKPKHNPRGRNQKYRTNRSGKKKKR